MNVIWRLLLDTCGLVSKDLLSFPSIVRHNKPAYTDTTVGVYFLATLLDRTNRYTRVVCMDVPVVESVVLLDGGILLDRSITSHLLFHLFHTTTDFDSFVLPCHVVVCHKSRNKNSSSESSHGFGVFKVPPRTTTTRPTTTATNHIREFGKSSR